MVLWALHDFAQYSKWLIACRSLMLLFAVEASVQAAEAHLSCKAGRLCSLLIRHLQYTRDQDLVWLIDHVVTASPHNQIIGWLFGMQIFVNEARLGVMSIYGDNSALISLHVYCREVGTWIYFKMTLFTFLSITFECYRWQPVRVQSIFSY